MKRLLILTVCFPLFALAQNKPLMIEGASPGLYLSHTVAPKENYYSIGRMYNISPKEIAPFNNLELEKGLSLNQAIKIPLTENNFIQSNIAAADEAAVPVYYTVKEKEGLYRISTNCNKVPVETLKQWNKIKGDAVSNGTKLIVGYLKVKKELSPLSGMAKALPATVAVKEKTESIKELVKPVVKPAPAPAVKKPTEENPVVKEPVKPAAEKPVTAAKPAATEPVTEKETAPVKTAASSRSAKNFNGGFFKNDFDMQARGTAAVTENGTAAIFKSTSGWEDGKYYCLHNTAASGTIIKITSVSSGKSVYAKVLDTIPDMSQNKGLLIRLSNAAAAELGAGEAKFECMVNYSK
jgi:LysM repeat protein